MSKRRSKTSATPADATGDQTPARDIETTDTAAQETGGRADAAGEATEKAGETGTGSAPAPTPAETAVRTSDEDAAEPQVRADASGDDHPEAASQAETPDAAAQDPAPEDGSGPGDADPHDPPMTQDVPEPRVIRETTIERRNGFVPTVLGGVLAAAAGFGLAQYLGTDLFGANGEPSETEIALRQSLDTQQQTLSDLASRLATLENRPPEVDLSPVTARIDGLEADQQRLSGSIGQIDATVGSLQESLAALAKRVDEIEQRPMTQALSPEAISAYERALNDLKSEVDRQRTELAQEIEAQRAEVRAMVDRASAAEAEAASQAVLAQARAALAQIVAALDTGAPFGEQLATATTAVGLETPPALQAASSGVQTQGALAAAFPDLARKALAASRTSGGSQATGITDFLKAQLGVRSLEAREGSDPDAVLSRAEAAVRSGNLAVALTEIESLPPEAQAVLSDWVAQARTRQAALDAAAELGQALNQQ